MKSTDALIVTFLFFACVNAAGFIVLLPVTFFYDFLWKKETVLRSDMIINHGSRHTP